MPTAILHRLPSSLQNTIKQRYEELGGKYLTDDEYFDGRRINSCMYNNSINDAVEEIVDAVFNVLVWIFKYQRKGENTPNSAYQSLLGLIEIYALLSVELERDPVA